MAGLDVAVKELPVFRRAFVDPNGTDEVAVPAEDLAMGSGRLVARYVDPRGLAGVTSRASGAVGDFMTATEARPAQVVKGFVVPVIEGGNQLSLRSVGQIGARGRRGHIEDALDLRPIVAKESLILIRHRLFTAVSVRFGQGWAGICDLAKPVTGH